MNMQDIAQRLSQNFLKMLEAGNQEYLELMQQTGSLAVSDILALEQAIKNFLRQKQSKRAAICHEVMIQFMGKAAHIKSEQYKIECKQFAEHYLTSTFGIIHQEEEWLLTEDLMDCAEMFLHFILPIQPLEKLEQYKFIKQILETFEKNMFRIRCLQILCEVFRSYRNRDFYSHTILFLLQFYPYLDYSKQRKKLELAGDIEVQLFDETMTGLMELLQIGSKLMRFDDNLLNAAINLASVPIVHFQAIKLIWHLIGQAQSLNVETNQKILEVSTLFIPPEGIHNKVYEGIYSYIISEFSIDKFCEYIINKLKGIFEDNQYLESLWQCLCMTSFIVKQKQDHFWFQSIHLLQNYCESLETKLKPPIVEKIINLLSFNVKALKRHPASIVALNKLISDNITLGWRFLKHLETAGVLHQSVFETLRNSIRKFEKKTVRAKLWGLILKKFGIQSYSENYDFEVVNLVGLTSIPGWRLTLSELEARKYNICTDQERTSAYLELEKMLHE